MSGHRLLTGIALTAALAATASIGISPAAAEPLPVADHAYILGGANADSWAPWILERIDPWATNGPLNPKIGANYYTCHADCVHLILYPRTAGPLFGPNAPFADESIAIGIRLTDEEIKKDGGQTVVSGLSLGSITADAVQRSLDADPIRPARSEITFIVAGDPSRVTPVSMGIGALLPEGVRVPIIGWTVTRPPADSTYDTVAVVGEYDVTADFPDRPWNVLALLNSVVGFQYAHSQSALTDPDDVPAQDIFVSPPNDNGGTTTTYLVRDSRLPLLKPLDGVVPEPVLNAANNVLKPIVDRGYSRNDEQTGNRMPYLKPTDGWPQLVTGPRVTESFKATPETTATGLPRLDRAVKASGGNRERLVKPLQRLRDVVRNLHRAHNAKPAAGDATVDQAHSSFVSAVSTVGA